MVPAGAAVHSVFDETETGMSVSIHHPVVIIGGGVAGLQVANLLSDNGFSSIIVERAQRLGGHVRDWACMATDQCMRCYSCSVDDLIERVQTSPRITVLEEWEVVAFLNAQENNRRTELRSLSSGDQKTLDCSAVVLAAGFEPYDAAEKGFLGYGRIPGVLTLQDMDNLLRNDALAQLPVAGSDPLRLAFFQCVGSRDSSIGRNYCSQYCCKAAVRTGLKILDLHPDWEITVFYIDLQMAGKYAGKLLSEAKRRNMRLIQGVPGEIQAGPDNTVEIVRQEKGRSVREQYHGIVLSIGQGPPASASSLASIMGIQSDEFGFLAGRNVLDSSRTSVPGVYVAGACAGPRDIEQTLTHAEQTVAAVVADLLTC